MMARATGRTPARRRRASLVAPRGMRSALTTWFPDDAAVARFRRRTLGRRPAVLPPHDAAWATMVPAFDRCVELAEAGVPFQVVAERDHDTRPDRRRLRDALAGGATVLLPQAHQVLPRVARLMVALRAEVLGPGRDEASYLFMVEGRGREGMGLHHDGDVDGFWLQLEGHRTVTVGPPVTRGVPEQIDEVPRGRRGWRTLTLGPGSLAYFPSRAPHRVVCHERSLALTFTWTCAAAARPAREASQTQKTGAAAARQREASQTQRPCAAAARPAREASQTQKTGAAVSPRARVESLTRWDVTSGRAEPWPPERDGERLWTQVPAVAKGLDRGGRVVLATPDGALRLPAGALRLARRLAAMPIVTPDALGADARWLEPMIESGILADEELPLVVTPDDPATLDGWRFA